MDILGVCSSGQLWDNTVVHFKVKQEYPLLFFSLLFNKCISRQNRSIIYLDLTASADDLFAQLETSFLGMSKIYFLGFLDELSKNVLDKWANYIQTYQGPNQLLYISCHDVPFIKSSHIRIEVTEDALSKKGFIELFTYFVKKPQQADFDYIDKIYAKTGALGLDVACMILHYMQVTGSKKHEFLQSWIDGIVIPDYSLFNLSQYLFAKETTSFLNYWRHMKMSYTEQFWIAFWSEQLWRAAYYCKYMQEGKFREAKTVAYRLPFSFLQKEYKKYSFLELSNAHDWLYTLDYDLKNGSSETGLDLFFYSFFAHDYKVQTIFS